MKKIRINELARELEVKAHEILELLPELGVSEKKTHSSSIDEDVAIKLRQHYGQDIPDYVHDPNADDSASEAHEEARGDEGHEAPAATALAPVTPAPEAPAEPEAAPGIFARGEALEFERGQPGAAAEWYRLPADSNDASIRAGALMRLGRVWRKAGRKDESCAAYARLAEIGGVRVAGAPASRSRQ